MKRINLIISHRNYLLALSKIEELEFHREFCRHDLNHFMDVARIAYILNLEGNLKLSKEIIYASALLHDIGRWRQYESHIPHEEASAELALEILKDCSFNDEEVEEIIKAIGNHRTEKHSHNSLDEILYRADKLSRACFSCKEQSKCYWPENKKNMTIQY